MHELSLITNIFQQALEAKAKKVSVTLGALKGVPKQQFTEMFRELAEGTEIEGADLEVREVPLTIRCACGHGEEIQDVPHIHHAVLDWPCPKCGKAAEIVTGNEMEITLS